MYGYNNYGYGYNAGMPMGNMGYGLGYNAGYYGMAQMPPMAPMPMGNPMMNNMGGMGYNNMGMPPMNNMYNSPMGGFNTQGIDSDCQMLNNAMHGVGTDEEAIIGLICSRNSMQRRQIKDRYKAIFGKDLIKQLKSELSGNFKDVVIGCFMTPPEYDAYCLYKAMKGLGTNEGVLTEIIGTRNNLELQAIKRCFQEMYGESLEKWVKDDTSGNYKKMLISLLQCQRSANTAPNFAQCQMDAQRLFQAGEGRWGTDETIFNAIFTQRSPAEIECISRCYQQLCSRTLMSVVGSEFSGDIKILIQTVLHGLMDLPGYYATRLRQALQGLGTNDSKLVRVIVARCEVDMPLIKQRYFEIYGRDLLTDVRDDTSGDYKIILTYIIERAM